jgi:hypothetical protein
LGDPQICADADSPEAMLRDGALVSNALTRAAVRHRFEVYEEGHREMVGYLHYDWPRAYDLQDQPSEKDEPPE